MGGHCNFANSPKMVVAQDICTLPYTPGFDWSHIYIIHIMSTFFKGVKMFLSLCLPHIMSSWQIASIMSR